MRKGKKWLNAMLLMGLLSASGICNADDIGVLPVVTVTDEYNVDYNGWGGYNPWWESEPYWQSAVWDWVMGYADTAGEGAALAAVSHIFKSSSVCVALVSNAARSTTSTSDVTSRWLAAQEVFTFIKNAGNLAQYREISRSLTFIIDGKRYDGFTVTYADGARETWAVNPGHATSSVKLLDQPLPNSLEPYEGKAETPKCNVG